MLLLVSLLNLLFLPLQASNNSYEYLYESDGIKVYSRTDGGLQCYKAEGLVQANLFELMAVISDLSKRQEWVKNLEFSRAISGDIASAVQLYEKYKMPWPASDRDTVTTSETIVDYKKLEIEANFFNSTHPDYPLKESIIRIPAIKGYQFFAYQSETTTLSRNTLCIDIGGDLPAWLVRVVSRAMPVDTLKSMQRQVEKTRGQYQEFIQQHKEKAAREGKE